MAVDGPTYQTKMRWHHPYKSHHLPFF